MDYNLEYLRQWVGHIEEQSEQLTPALVQRFLATFDREGVSDVGADAPLLIHHCLAQPAVPARLLGEDGHPARGDFLPPVPLPIRMWAGGQFDFHAPLRIGDQVSRRSRIVEVAMKQGRSGALCFVLVKHHVYGAESLAVTERQDIVYRLSTVSSPAATEPAAQGTHQSTVRPDAALLFRYSALTFNGHRIHYDRIHAMQTEGYPGLVVHGPLQATLLVQMAQDIAGRSPVRFSFRSLSALFDCDDMALNARWDGDDLELWTARPGGPVAMLARACW